MSGDSTNEESQEIFRFLEFHLWLCQSPASLFHLPGPWLKVERMADAEVGWGSL